MHADPSIEPHKLVGGCWRQNLHCSHASFFLKALPEINTPYKFLLMTVALVTRSVGYFDYSQYLAISLFISCMAFVINQILRIDVVHL